MTTQSTLPIWQQESFKETAAIWERGPSPAGARHTLFAPSVPCYHFPDRPKDDEITEFGQLVSTVYVWVFAEAQAVPRQVCIVNGGIGYVSINAPVKTPNIGLGEGGNVQVRTHIVSPLPPGVTL